MSNPFDHLPNTLDDLQEALQAPLASPKALPSTYTAPRHLEACPKCRGTGRFVGRNGRVFGPCFTCKGAGQREFATSPEARAQAKVARVRSAATSAAANAEAFELAHPAIWAWIFEARATFGFAQAMFDAVVKYGSLTEKQMAACQKCVDGRQRAQEARQERAATAPTVDVSQIETALSTAFANGLKSPKLRVAAFKFSKASATSANPGAIYVKEGSEYLGKIVGGRFLAVSSCGSEREQQILAAAAAPKEAAIAYGRLTGSCSCCGRELTDPKSIEIGVGPICLEKYGW